MVCFVLVSHVRVTIALILSISIAQTNAIKFRRSSPAIRGGDPDAISSPYRPTAVQDSPSPFMVHFFPTVRRKRHGLPTTPPPEDAIQVRAAPRTETAPNTDPEMALQEAMEAIQGGLFMSLVPTMQPTAGGSAVTIPNSTQTNAPTNSSPPDSNITQQPAATNPPPLPTVAPTAVATQAPTLQGCRIPASERVARIMAILDAHAANPALLRNDTLPQGQATTWLLSQDERQVCPDDPNILQRWTAAVVYFSTGGNEWTQCSANPAATDNCGSEFPFQGERRFLSGFSECEWAGVYCTDGILTMMDYEMNNLDGTIPTEVGLLTGLVFWMMEQGGLQSTIPTEIGLLTNLRVVDFDFNELTGSLPTELANLVDLEQLDLNDNRLSGTIDVVSTLTNLDFLQVHNNLFTGTIPEAIGTFSNLAAFTLHGTDISGTMPQSICDNTVGNGGVLGSLIAACAPPAKVICSCCTNCRRSSL